MRKAKTLGEAWRLEIRSLVGGSGTATKSHRVLVCAARPLCDVPRIFGGVDAGPAQLVPGSGGRGGRAAEPRISFRLRDLSTFDGLR